MESAKDKARSKVEKLRKETSAVDRKIQAAHSALVDVIAAEIEDDIPTIELMERVEKAIKTLVGQE